jgi:hypothetical protein
MALMVKSRRAASASKLSDAEGSRVEVDGHRAAHLRDARAVQVEALVVGAGVLVVGADDVAPGPVPERARDVVLQRLSGPNRYQEKPPG